MSIPRHDVAVLGGGIVGLATARALCLDGTRSVVVLEAEREVASHQTGHNSGVIHSGLYYKPGSLKARNCTAGREAMIRYCDERGIPHERCGKIVVATDREHLPALDELERRGTANGLEALRRLGPEELAQFEPHVRGLAALHVPQTGIVDYGVVARSMATEIGASGGEVRTGARALRVERRGGRFVVETTAGPFEARVLIACAGLQCDRVARLCGLEPDLRIVPFRGEYYRLKPHAERLVRNLIYPVPDSRFPFLGVHFTRMIGGGVEAGPNAVLSFKREGYGRFSFSPRDTLSIVGYGGFWRLASSYWRTGLGEFHRSHSRSAFVRALQALVPEIRNEDVERHGAGVRAQAVRPDGRLIDDFQLLEADGQIHVLNAPSPAATASLSIGQTIAARAVSLFSLDHRSAAV